MLINLCRHRYKDENVFIITVIPGPKKPKDLFSFLYPLVQELMVLEGEGMVIENSQGESQTYKVHLTSVVGDIPGIADMCGHSGHTSYSGCRICTIIGTYSRGMYFPPRFTEYGDIQEYGKREMNEYRHFNDREDAPIKKVSPLTLLDGFHGAEFWGLDEMHLWGQNIGRQLWALATDDSQKYGIQNPFFLRKRYRELVSSISLRAKEFVPRGCTDGDLVDMQNKGGNARAVDVIDFVQYLVPTAFVAALKQQRDDIEEKRGRKKQKVSSVQSFNDFVTEEATEEVCEALKSLARACRITEQFRISQEELAEFEV